MLDDPRAKYHALVRRVRRFERREVREFRQWLEHTANLLHLTILLVVPMLIAIVTAISNGLDVLPFVLFPPLASGTYTLFADPEGEYASPTKFVGGLTAGALCGTVAIWVARHTGLRDTLADGALAVSPGAAALAIFLTGAVTWALDFEEPSAFSTALLALVAPAFAGPASVGEFLVQYAGSVFVASSIVAFAFEIWRREFYERRSRFLYQSTKGDDHVLVPMRGERASAAATFGARLAAAHDAGKVVLLDVVDESAVEEATEKSAGELVREPDAGTADGTETGAETETADGTGGGTETEDRTEGETTGEVDEQIADNEQIGDDEKVAADESARELEDEADRIKTEIGVPCEVAVVGDGTNRAATVLKAARDTNCDLIVTPYEEANGGLSPFVRRLFRGNIDAIAFRSAADSDPRERWKRVLVPVRRPGDTAHAMIDFARRLTGLTGSVSVCTCIESERQRRPTETMLANLVETVEASFETRVSRASIESFLSTNAPHYDLVVMGASTDRSSASRFVSPPTFERLNDLESDVAIFHRG